VLAATIVFVLLLGIRTHWLPYQPGGLPDSAHPVPGEMFTGLDNGERYLRDGFRYWLLENRPDAEGKAKLYTHNVNINGPIQLVLRLAGVNSHVPLALINAIAFFAGIWFGYLAVLRASRDEHIALLFLFFLATNYYFNLLFAFNLRAWHWLGLFGTLLCTLLMSGDDAERRHGQIWIFPATFIAFSCAYDFAAEVGCAALAIAALYRSARAAVMVVLGFAVAFALRQLQVT
jgi:hypothetical protein